VTRTRFVDPARREHFAEVGLLRRQRARAWWTLSSVEDATARALGYPLTGSQATERTGRMILKDF
jgi:hypothetical protein